MDKDNSKTPEEKSSQESLRSTGIFLMGTSLLAAIATFKEGGIVGAGLGAGGALLCLAGYGAGRGWKLFPVVPVIAATATLLLMCYGCFRSLAAH